jgi:hypothetical protein
MNLLTYPTAKAKSGLVFTRYLRLPTKLLYYHYGIRRLPRVPNTLEEGAKTLGEGFPLCNTRGRPSGMLLTGKPPSPSAKSRALGEAFPECQATSRGQFNVVDAISFVYLFPECNTRGRNSFFWKPLPRVQHSGALEEDRRQFFYYKPSSPSAAAQALGEATSFFCKN